MQCKKCNGTGSVQVYLNYSLLDGRAVYLPCSNCNGSGQIEKYED